MLHFPVRSWPLLFCLSTMGAGLGMPSALAREPITQFTPPKPGQLAPAGVGDGQGDFCENPLPESRRGMRSQFLLPAIVDDDNRPLAHRTSQEHPSFWIAVAPTTASKLTFEVRDRTNRAIHQQSIRLRGVGEWVQVVIPADQPALQAGQTYTVSFHIQCDDEPQTTDYRQEFPLERVAVDIPSRRDLRSLYRTCRRDHEESLCEALALVGWLGEEGLWLDAVRAFESLPHTPASAPTLETHWSALLTSGGLDSLDFPRHALMP